MPNPLYTYIVDTYDLFGFGWVYGISTIEGYLMPNPLYTYILNIYDLIWLDYSISTVVGYLMRNPSNTGILNMYDSKIYFVDKIVKLCQHGVFFPHIVIWFKILSANTNIFFYYQSFACTLSNNFIIAMQR